MSITKEQLENAVAELNDKICDPPIKLKDSKKAKKKILEAAKLIEKSDKITKETMTVINELKDKKEKKSTKTKPEAKTKSTKTKSTKTKSEAKSSGTKKMGVGAYIVENLKNGKFDKLSNNQIVERVMKKFPEAKTKASNIGGYRKAAA